MSAGIEFVIWAQPGFRLQTEPRLQLCVCFRYIFLLLSQNCFFVMTIKKFLRLLTLILHSSRGANVSTKN